MRYACKWCKRAQNFPHRHAAKELTWGHGRHVAKRFNMAVSRSSISIAPGTQTSTGGMLYRALFMVVALLATAQAQEDPCVGHDYAEAHCARLPACTSRAFASA